MSRIRIRIAGDINIAAERGFTLPVSRALVAEPRASSHAGSIFSVPGVGLVAIGGVPAVAGAVIRGQAGRLVGAAAQFVPRTRASGDAASERAASTRAIAVIAAAAGRLGQASVQRFLADLDMPNIRHRNRRRRFAQTTTTHVSLSSTLEDAQWMKIAPHSHHLQYQSPCRRRCRRRKTRFQVPISPFRLDQDTGGLKKVLSYAVGLISGAHHAASRVG
ncbi:MAG: hypothetical protein LQ348_007481 [Seirophora lacunosa]|nr:MAG: hypothetical protein LQ348_007481 [Seirophora lacunosa]